MVLSQIIANGIIIGSIYALVAVGFSLIYSTNKFMYFAQGVSVVIASYFLLYFYKDLGLNLLISIVLVLVLSTLFGYLNNKLVYTPLQKRKTSNIILLIASIAILILFENIIVILFGSSVKTINIPFLSQTLQIFGATLTVLQCIIIIVSIILLILLYLFMNFTKIGRNLRAVADNKELSEIAGINSNKIVSISFILGSFIAGIAGILIALEQTLEPTIGTTLIIKGFTGAIIGGITSVPASIIGSYFLGLVENIGVYFLSASYRDAIAFVLLFIFLLFRPNGLFGINKGVKK